MSTAGRSSPAIICLSHLRWDFVWQRPQQLMVRFAKNRRVYFIEEPIFEGRDNPSADQAVWSLQRSPVGAPAPSPTSGVTVAQPICRDPGPDGGPALDAMYARLVAELVEAESLEDYIVWFYTPMLLSSIAMLPKPRIVFDAMDELSLFKFAPRDLLIRERELMARASVVFAGGFSLGEAKARLHDRVRTFPSGVEIEHFQSARFLDGAVPADLAAIPSPRVGYIGVIDERLDLALLAECAALRPSVAWVMIGPVVKISEADLPQAPNLHYLGSKAYRTLPAYIAGLSVCMMPFALNDSTRFISPTKTLEYLAAERVVVSTPVTDVVRTYGDVVRIGATADAFVGHIDDALHETPDARARRLAIELPILQANTWDSIADAMDVEMSCFMPEGRG